MAKQRNCPNCGADLPKLLRHARMINCDYCESSIVLEDEALTLAGSAGVMLDAPELIGLGRSIDLGQRGIFTATGHVRYDYGRGHWDEYFGTNVSGRGYWISVDEGDVAIQEPLARDDIPREDVFRIGAVARIAGETYTTTEVETATCLAFRGQLPEPVAVGEAHLYANMSGEGTSLVSAERWDGGAAWFSGVWIDPWTIRRA